MPTSEGSPLTDWDIPETRRASSLPGGPLGRTDRRMGYEPRTYRRMRGARGPHDVRVSWCARRTFTSPPGGTWPMRPAALVEAARADIEAYVARDRRFAESFVPYEVGPDAPAIVREMAVAASAAGVGPMAAVAGAIAEHVARGLVRLSPEVIVENGGDVFIAGGTDRVVALHAGASPLSGRVGIVVDAALQPLRGVHVVGHRRAVRVARPGGCGMRRREERRAGRRRGQRVGQPGACPDRRGARDGRGEGYRRRARARRRSGRDARGLGIRAARAAGPLDAFAAATARYSL